MDSMRKQLIAKVAHCLEVAETAGHGVLRFFAGARPWIYPMIIG